MFLVPKNDNHCWQPSATIATLKARAQFLQAIRLFFAKSAVLEVDTPMLSQSVVTAPHLASFHFAGRYLQTSPEYAMKRLLAAGIGPIYSLGKVFRLEEVGARHNPEFTMLEWYRPGWDHWQLIHEVDALFQTMLNTQPAKIVTYQQLFEDFLDIQPHIASKEHLEEKAIAKGWVQKGELVDLDKEAWLDLCISYGIEPYLGQSEPVVVIDFPGSQAGLAKTRVVQAKGLEYEVAERFEFYYRGMELANGYHELVCATTQRQRFEEDLAKREALGLDLLPIDEALLSALSAGLPPCAGVALGVDRFLMLKLGMKEIAHVLPFAWERA